MMKEYWNKPEHTAEIFRGDWYYSGDVLVRDEDGDFWFKGRNDDVIKASGYRISPFEVESCLVSHPAVLEAAAVESPDPVRGMVVKAFVVLREGLLPSDSLAEQIQEHVKRSIAPYKYPRRIEFVTALPKPHPARSSDASYASWRGLARAENKANSRASCYFRAGRVGADRTGATSDQPTSVSSDRWGTTRRSG